ncbi:efflux RND transporter permease subunit [Metabacillus sediminilitoris]|uniref:Efflux RND transporter permease subunit n=1 Tax=Metabacillus sediminilitoris TaxID=2567941 RepID=A0A4S4C081_9BACI|nr:efflux RND transporter permease subunit [Metabacillus sediminilitoris]QGQ47945.1 MMPL family transporter [Metabacillus sediminilitoris]THF80941.1 efflux RND transporter permease subunit [Metabacillus sediminilitoris]
MSWFTKWSFKNKAAVAIMSLLVLVMGVLSYFRLPMEFLPSADQPFISVVIVGEGLDASSMEEQVTTPIEEAVDRVNGKVNVFSTTGDGYSSVDIHLESSVDKKEAKREIEDALANVQLPDNVMKPNIVQLNTSMIPVSYISLTFDKGINPETIQYAKDEIVPYFKNIDGVADIQTNGTIPSYVSVELDEKKMAEKKVSIEHIMPLLQGQNIATAVGEKNVDGKTSNIKVVGDLNTVEKLENTEILPSIPLKDVASITIEKQENNLTKVNGHDALTFVITKDSNSNAVTISKEAKKVSQEVNDKYDNLETNVILSTADTVESSVQSMMKEVLLGALFATIVIMLFLRNLRSTLITIVSIPLSLGFTLFLLAQSGVTLNILTLGGVAVAVGRLVDDSIVVIENIFRRAQTENFSVKMVIEATKEVGSAITSSTLTTVAVFLPLGLLSGSLQDFMLPFALTITYSLLASLLVALTVVPLMSAGLLKNAKIKEHKPSARFEKFLTWSLNHKWIVVLTALILFCGSIGAYIMLPKGSVDKTKADYVFVSLEYPNETPIEKVKEESIKLEEYILKQDGIDNVYLQLGNSEDAAKYGEVGSPTETQILTTLKADADMGAFIETINTQKDEYKDATLEATEATIMGGGATSITIDVIGDDVVELINVSENVQAEIEEIEGVEKVTSNQEETKTVYSFVVDPGLAKADQVAQQAAVMLNKTPLGTIEINDLQTMVMLEPVFNPETEKELSNVPIMTANGMTTIAKVAELKETEEPTSTFHKDGEQYVRVTATVDPEKLSTISEEVNKKIYGDKTVDGLELPDNVEVLVGGASVDQASEFNDLFMTMLASIGIVFLIMVITFKTIRAPIAILFSLPLAAIGAILGIVISGITVDVTALLGALMLIGIVVTNAIVLLDRVKQNEQTMIIRDALVEAATIRMRPIIMTAVATISAMLPLLFKEAEMGNLVSASLAIVVIGGLSVATLLTLVVIPVIYELLHFKKAKRQRLKAEKNGETLAG